MTSSNILLSFALLSHNLQYANLIFNTLFALDLLVTSILTIPKDSQYQFDNMLYLFQCYYLLMPDYFEFSIYILYKENNLLYLRF